jgi:hypothetical protein
MDQRYLIFVVIVVLFAALVWRLRAPRQRDEPDAAEVDNLRREQDRAVGTTADLNDSVHLRRARLGDESRHPPTRR